MKKTKRIIAWLLIFVLLLGTCGCAKAQMSFDEQYDLGMKYLSEGKYEEAILAFEAAIKIDTKRATAYIGLSDAYTEMGDTEKAKEILQAGYEAIESEEIKIKLEEYTVGDDGHKENNKEELLQTAWSYFENQPEKAAEYFERLLEIAETKSEKHEILHRLGDVYGEIGFNNYADNAQTPDEWRADAIPFFKRAKEYFILSLDYAETNEEKYHSYDRIAWVSTHTDEGEDSVIYGKKALEYAFTDEQKYEEYMTIANGYDRLEHQLNGNDSIEATEYYELALSVSGNASEKDI